MRVGVAQASGEETAAKATAVGSTRQRYGYGDCGRVMLPVTHHPWRVTGCQARTSALRPVLNSSLRSTVWPVDGLGEPVAHATSADGPTGLVGIAVTAVTVLFMMPVAP